MRPTHIGTDRAVTTGTGHDGPSRASSSGAAADAAPGRVSSTRARGRSPVSLRRPASSAAAAVERTWAPAVAAARSNAAGIDGLQAPRVVEEVIVITRLLRSDRPRPESSPAATAAGGVRSGPGQRLVRAAAPGCHRSPGSCVRTRCRSTHPRPDQQRYRCAAARAAGHGHAKISISAGLSPRPSSSPPQLPRTSANTSSRNASTAAVSRASTFRRSSGSVFDGRRLNHEPLGHRTVRPSSSSSWMPSRAAKRSRTAPSWPAGRRPWS